MMKTVRVPLNIEVLPYLRDHTFEGRTIFPAVEALQRLAASTAIHVPEIYPQAMYHATFARFLEIRPGETEVEAFHEIDFRENGAVTSRLITISSSRSGAITRAKVHAKIDFRKDVPAFQTAPSYQRLHLAGESVEVSAEDLYRDLVPFEKSYQNAFAPIRMTRQAATAKLLAPVLPAPQHPLGSPFPMDAALHCACAWSQRYTGIVAFPVGFDKRIIFHPTLPGETYAGLIIPVKTDKEPLRFDISIFNNDNLLFEFITGVQMQDVSGGRRKPPLWIRDFS